MKACSTDSDEGTVSAPSQALLMLIVEDKEDYEKSWCYCNQLRSAVIMRRKGACTNQGFTVNAYDYEASLRQTALPSCVKLPVFKEKA